MTMLNDNQLKALKEAAAAASLKAYAPYSKFPVGAAVLAGNGKIYAGCNVENASFGLTMCAERNAIFQMVADGQRELLAVAIFTPTDTPTAPCGACRQVINEFAPTARVVSYCATDAVLNFELSALLPAAFGPANLG